VTGPPWKHNRHPDLNDVAIKVLKYPSAPIYNRCCKGRIRLEIEIEIGLEFNQSEERKSISSLVNFALIDQNLIQFQSQSLVWYGL